LFYLQKIHHHTGGLEIYISSGGGSVFYSPPHLCGGEYGSVIGGAAATFLSHLCGGEFSSIRISFYLCYHKVCCRCNSPPHRWLRKVAISDL
jgi:hypothetical protein